MIVKLSMKLTNILCETQLTESGKIKEQDNSGLEVELASMASFQPSGLLYDGNGVQPDILIEPIPTDFLMDQTDSVLDAAIEFILESR